MHKPWHAYVTQLTSVSTVNLQSLLMRLKLHDLVRRGKQEDAPRHEVMKVWLQVQV
jgi:hypothetical protein